MSNLDVETVTLDRVLVMAPPFEMDDGRVVVSRSATIADLVEVLRAEGFLVVERVMLQKFISDMVWEFYHFDDQDMDDQHEAWDITQTWMERFDALAAAQKEERPYPYMLEGESLEDANRRVASQKEAT